MIATLPLLYPVLAAAGFVVLATLVIGRWAPVIRMDSTVSEAARGYGTGHPDFIRVTRVLTDTAQAEVLFAVGLSAIVVLLVTRRAYAEALFICLVFATVPSIRALLQWAIHRPRPVDGFVAVPSYGFPSGHTSNAVAAGLAVVLLLWPRLTRRGRAVTVALAACFAVYIGVTRIALLAHWPTDVLGGWLLALALVPLLARTVVALPLDKVKS